DNGKIYLAGGYNTATVDSAQTTTWEFDPAAGTFTQKADMPHGLGGAASGIIGGHLYVAGGRDAGNLILDTVYDYDIATDTWTQRASMPQVENVPGSGVAGGKLWAFGYGNPFAQFGLDRLTTDAVGPAAATTTLSYDPATDTWTA